jgi:hypothetical protein
MRELILDLKHNVLDSIKQEIPFSVLNNSQMMAIRTTYMLTKNWMGDPCAPKAFAWDGRNFRYSSSGPASVTAL